MFKLLRKPPADTHETTGPDTLQPRRMDLQERMAFRREMARQVIRDCLESLGVPVDAFRLRIMPLDARHHRFIAMLDVNGNFWPSRAGVACDQETVESEICTNGRGRFGLAIDGIYWRTGSDRSAFERRSHARSGDVGSDQVLAHPRPWLLVSEEEKQALIDAIQKGSELPALHVGELEYQSDVAPLSPQPSYPAR